MTNARSSAVSTTCPNVYRPQSRAHADQTVRVLKRAWTAHVNSPTTSTRCAGVWMNVRNKVKEVNKDSKVSRAKAVNKASKDNRANKDKASRANKDRKVSADNKVNKDKTDNRDRKANAVNRARDNKVSNKANSKVRNNPAVPKTAATAATTASTLDHSGDQSAAPGATTASSPLKFANDSAKLRTLRREWGTTGLGAGKLDEVIEELKRLADGRMEGDAATASYVKQEVIEPLRQLELELSRHLQQLSGRTNLRLRDEGAAPEKYRRAVEEYYRRLSGARPKQ